MFLSNGLHCKNPALDGSSVCLNSNKDPYSLVTSPDTIILQVIKMSSLVIKVERIIHPEKRIFLSEMKVVKLIQQEVIIHLLVIMPVF